MSKRVPEFETFFDMEKDTWVVAYRHASKYIGRIAGLEFPGKQFCTDAEGDACLVEGGNYLKELVRAAHSVKLDCIVQLLTPTKQTPVDKNGDPATRPQDVTEMLITAEPVILPVDFCAMSTPMYFEGADIQRFFHDFSEEDLEIYKHFIKGALDAAVKRQAKGANLVLVGADGIPPVRRGR